MANARVLKFDERYKEEAELTNEGDSYTRHFTAKVSSLEGHILALRRHRSDLQMFQPHPEDPAAFVVAFRPEMIGPLHFDITVEYSTDIETSEDPLAQPAEITFDDVEVILPRIVDRKGKPMLNTAGSPIIVEEDFDFTVCNVRKNIAAVPSWWGDYAGAVNNDTFRVGTFTFPPRTAKIKHRHIGPQIIENDIAYHECSFSLYHNPDTWDARPLNVGMLEVRVRSNPNGASTRTPLDNYIRDLVPVLNNNHEPISEPVFLNKYGQRPRVRRNGTLITGEFVEDEIFEPWRIKNPLDPKDIITLRFETRNLQPFKRLPLR